MDYQKELIKAMAQLDEEKVFKYVQMMLASGFTHESIRACLTKGSEEVGDFFESGEYFIADLIVSGMIYQRALSMLIPKTETGNPHPIGRVVIGVVENDIHDIGKDIVVSLLRSERFEVIDLGVDVKPQRFVHALTTYQPDIILLSGLLNSSSFSMIETMNALNAQHKRKETVIYIGGQCVSQQLCDQMGADGWGYDTFSTVDFCKKVIK